MSEGCHSGVKAVNRGIMSPSSFFIKGGTMQATSSSCVMAPNGMVVSTEKLAEVRSKLVQLEQESHFALGELVRVSRNPYYPLTKETREMLILKDLLNKDSTNNFVFQNIIQYLFPGDGFSLEIISFDKMLDTFQLVVTGPDVE